MNYDIKMAMEEFSNVREMLDGIPEELWSIFVPEHYDDITYLDRNIERFKARQAERDRVMSIQRLCELPLRPNSSLHETKTKARLEGMKKNQLRKDLRNRQDDSDTLPL